MSENTEALEPTHPHDPAMRVDLWGPPRVGGVEGFAMHAPRKKKAWGPLDVLWAFLLLLLTQIIILPVLAVIAIAKYNIQMDAVGGPEALTEALTKVATSGPGLVLALLSQWVAFVGAPMLSSWLKGHQSLAKDFGFSFKKTDLPYGLAIAAGLQVLMYAISWTLNLTNLDLSGADNTGQVTDHVGLLLAFMVLGAAIGAPLTEELLFRGLILRAFLRRFALLDQAPLLPGVTDHLHNNVVSPTRRKVGIAASVILSSAIFGFMHVFGAFEDGFSAGYAVLFAQTGLLGVFFAIIAIKTGRIGLPIMAHLFFNSTSLAITLVAAAYG